VSAGASSGRGAWTQPAVEPVSDGVYRVPLPLPNDGLRAVNVYVLTGRDGVTLVDAGWSIEPARELLLASLAELDVTPADIDQFLVTHVHRDHYTQAVALRREFGTRVALGRDEEPSLDALTSRTHHPMRAQLDALRRMGARELADSMQALLDAHTEAQDLSDWEYPDTWLTDGPLVTRQGRELEVVSTPGHTNGHVVFHDHGAGLLFAGDHVLPEITPSIGLEPVVGDNPLGAFLGSLAKVRERPDAVLLPAHGPVASSVHARVDELVAHHGTRLDATEQAVAHGATSAFEAAQQLTWTRRERALADLDPFNQMLAIGETGAHLRLLVAQGRLRTETGADGVVHHTA
jgi:glyoxylase-like metal-dependent hydrolase (beta-lactamase superfamily II)